MFVVKEVVEEVVEDIVVEDVEEEEDETEEEERENPTVLRHRQFHREIFRPYDSLLDLLRSSSGDLLEGRGNCQLASISTTPSPAISKDTRKPPHRPCRRACRCHLCSRPSIDRAIHLSKSMSLLPLLETPSITRLSKSKSSSPLLKTECEIPGRGYCQKKSGWKFLPPNLSMLHLSTS
jgi:hypothetical protein